MEILYQNRNLRLIRTKEPDITGNPTTIHFLEAYSQRTKTCKKYKCDYTMLPTLRRIDEQGLTIHANLIVKDGKTLRGHLKKWVLAGWYNMPVEALNHAAIRFVDKDPLNLSARNLRFRNATVVRSANEIYIWLDRVNTVVRFTFSKNLWKLFSDPKTINAYYFGGKSGKRLRAAISGTKHKEYLSAIAMADKLGVLQVDTIDNLIMSLEHFKAEYKLDREIDHLNGDPYDNRASNLALLTPENNRKKYELYKRLSKLPAPNGQEYNVIVSSGTYRHAISVLLMRYKLHQSIYLDIDCFFDEFEFMERLSAIVEDIEDAIKDSTEISYPDEPYVFGMAEIPEILGDHYQECTGVIHELEQYAPKYDFMIDMPNGSDVRITTEHRRPFSEADVYFDGHVAKADVAKVLKEFLLQIKEEERDETEGSNE